MTAPLTVAGTYGGSITLIYAGRRETTPLLITRSAPAANGRNRGREHGAGHDVPTLELARAALQLARNGRRVAQA